MTALDLARAWEDLTGPQAAVVVALVLALVVWLVWDR